MMKLSSRTLLALIWLAFVTRGIYYCVQQPMWEGFDEWAHYAYIQHLAENGRLPERTDPVSPDVQQSLRLVPLSRAAAADVSGSVTHDEFWKLSTEERGRREREIAGPQPPTDNGLPRNTQYEAQQPPLYYALMTPVYLSVRSMTLPGRILMLRIVSLSIVSAGIFLGYAIAVRALEARRSALLVVVFVALFPGLLINVCRVGNESLSIALTTGVILCSVIVVTQDSRVRMWLLFGVLLGAAMLTKAYAVAFLPLVPVAALLSIAAKPADWKRVTLLAGLACVTAAALAGWWYWRTWLITGTLSGEQLDAAAAQIGFAAKLSAALSMDWRVVIDAGAGTHIWTGGWSFLSLRSWMYRVFECIGLLAAAGVVVHIVRSFTRRLPAVSILLIAACCLMWAAVAYHAIIIHLVQQIQTALGWYAYSVFPAEAVLLGVGFGSLIPGNWLKRALAFVCFLAFCLDLYTVHFLLAPYYTGLIAHQSGRLVAFRVDMLSSPEAVEQVFQRLAVNEASAVTHMSVMAAWAAYLIATVSLVVIAVVIARNTHTVKNT